MIFITALFSLIVTISIFSQIYIYICFLEWYIEYFSNKRSKFSLEEKKLNKIRSVDSEVSMTIFSVNLFINRGPYNFLSWFFWFKDYQIFFLRDIPWTEPSRDNSGIWKSFPTIKSCHTRFRDQALKISAKLYSKFWTLEKLSPNQIPVQDQVAKSN